MYKIIKVFNLNVLYIYKGEGAFCKIKWFTNSGNCGTISLKSILLTNEYLTNKGRLVEKFPF